MYFAFWCKRVTYKLDEDAVVKTGAEKEDGDKTWVWSIPCMMIPRHSVNANSWVANTIHKIKSNVKG